MYRLAYTTLATPDWTWERILDRTAEYGYQGLELRGVEGEMDLTRARPFAPERLAATRSELESRNIPICCVDTSCRLHDPETEKNLDEARRHIELAAELGAPSIRVFGDKIPDDEPRERVLERVARGLLALGEDAQGAGVDVLIESHGDFSRSADLREALRMAEHPRVGVLWDVHHPFRFYGEPVAETYEALRSRIRHTHLKDSRTTPEGPRYCVVGEGDVPLEEVLRLLHAGGYDGWLSFEWEKKWHPEIEEPEVALPAYVRNMRAAEERLGIA